MIERLARKLGHLQYNHPYKVLFTLLLFAAITLLGLADLRIIASTEAILPQTTPEVQDLDTLRNEFYGDTVSIVIQTQDATTRTFLDQMDAATQRLKLLENVGGVQSPTTALRQQYGTIPTERETLRNAAYGPTMSPAKDTALILLQTDTQASTPETEALLTAVRGVLRGQGLETQSQITGYNVIDYEMFGVILTDFTKITGFAFTAVLTTLYLYFRDVKKIFLTVTPVMYALLVMVGLGTLLGAQLNIISMVSAAMVMGLGIDFGIHIVKTMYVENLTETHLKEKHAELSKGLLGGALTTSTGFLALLAAQLTGMHSLGIYLATGIIAAYIAATALLPTLIVLIQRIPQ
jgi:hypothetical protein